MATKSPKKVFSDVEKMALQDTARERKAAARRGSGDERTEGEREVQAKIAELEPEDRAMAARIHELVTTSAPDLVPRTFYGMPAYATAGKNGKVICFFQAKSKYKVRYSTLGFQPDARLDDGELWPIGFAVTGLSPRTEARIVELVKQAAG